MASHWGPPAQPGGVTHLPQLSCHLCHTDGLTGVIPLPSPDPAVILSLLTQPWSPSDVPTVPVCPCAQEGDVVPLLSASSTAWQNLPRVPSGLGVPWPPPGGGSRAGGDMEGPSPLWAARVGHVDVGQKLGGWDGTGGIKERVTWH